MLAERGASAWARPLQQQRCVAAPLRRPYRRGRCAAAPPPSAAAADEPAAPSASGRPDSARGLTVDRQLATLQGLIQSQAEAVAALTSEVEALRRASAAQAACLAEAARAAEALGAELEEARGAARGAGSAVTGYPAFTLEDFRRLPDRFILVRHAESVGNLDSTIYSQTPDYDIPLSSQGHEQAAACGRQIRSLLDAEYDGAPYKLHFITSPYTRSRQTFVGIRYAFEEAQVAGVHEAVQLREQDFGNFQVPHRIQNDIKERNRFGRFYYRFPDGESTADVYNRVAIAEDNLLRDIRAGEFPANSTIVIISHGLTLRVLLMRFFGWTVEEFLRVYNPPNATPLLITKLPEGDFLAKSMKHRGMRQTLRIKACYSLDRSHMSDLLKISPDATLEACDLTAQVYN